MQMPEVLRQRFPKSHELSLRDLLNDQQIIVRSHKRGARLPASGHPMVSPRNRRNKQLQRYVILPPQHLKLIRFDDGHLQRYSIILLHFTHYIEHLLL